MTSEYAWPHFPQSKPSFLLFLESPQEIPRPLISSRGCATGTVYNSISLEKVFVSRKKCNQI